MTKETIDIEACKTRPFPEIKHKMDLIDWQNTKEACINQINAAYLSIELQQAALTKANTMIIKLSR